MLAHAWQLLQENATSNSVMGLSMDQEKMVLE